MNLLDLKYGEQRTLVNLDLVVTRIQGGLLYANNGNFIFVSAEQASKDYAEQMKKTNLPEGPKMRD